VSASPCRILLIKLGKMRCMGHLTRKGFRNSEGKSVLGRHMGKWEGSVGINYLKKKKDEKMLARMWLRIGLISVLYRARCKTSGFHRRQSLFD